MRQPENLGSFLRCGPGTPGPYRSAVQKKRAKVARHSLFAFCGLAVEVFLVLQGVPGVLDIVIVVQGIQQLAHLDQLVGVGQRGGGGRHLCHVGGDELVALLLQRVADSGEVLVGGVNVKNIAKEDLTNAVSYVFQDSKLITGSIFDNIRLAKPDADLDEVMSAIEKAQCKDIIEKFESGVNTVIGSNGVYLSGGEAQRIAIARAILKNAPIVILDEATAFADPDNEVKIQKALNELSKSKTVIMIAHRLSTVKNADCIFVLQNGKLIEQGKTEELCSQNGVFASMLKNYLTSVKWKVGKEELK